MKRKSSASSPQAHPENDRARYFGNRLCHARMSRGLSTIDIANAVGFCNATPIEKIESNQATVVPLTDILRLAEYLDSIGVSMRWMFAGKGAPKTIVPTIVLDTTNESAEQHLLTAAKKFVARHGINSNWSEVLQAAMSSIIDAYEAGLADGAMPFGKEAIP